MADQRLKLVDVFMKPAITQYQMGGDMEKSPGFPVFNTNGNKKRFQRIDIGFLDLNISGNQGFILDENGQRIQDLPMVGIFEIKPGQALEGVIAGGGGYGDPLNRDPDRVRHDVRKGWVTVEKARRTYGVVLDLEPELFAVDHEATGKLRTEIKKTRAKASGA